jgi:hypothetical protein
MAIYYSIKGTGKSTPDWKSYPQSNAIYFSIIGLTLKPLTGYSCALSASMGDGPGGPVNVITKLDGLGNEKNISTQRIKA